MSQYAQLSDLTIYGLPATALGTLTPTQQTDALISASAIMDSYFNGRYQLPLITWGVEVTEACCRIAAYNLLSVRGYNPASAADVNIRDRYVDTIDWLNKVQRQAAHPNVTPTLTTSGANWIQPQVLSSSVVGLSSGVTARNRGW